MLVTALSWLYLLGALFDRLERLLRLRAALARLKRARSAGYRRSEAKTGHFPHSRRKPDWVARELLRLRALMPLASYREITRTFNRLFAATRRMTVGRTFVWQFLRKHHYASAMLRKQIKNAQPRPVPKHLVWGMDLTGKPTLDGKTHLVLAILEHASRAVLCLEALPNKSSSTLILKLVGAIKRYGRPYIVRTDNESIFTSRLFRLALFLLGVQQQKTDPGCPWQNGRIERFFGTLKKKLDQLAVDSFEALNGALGEFRFFYNHVRAHQNLGGRTPAEAWSGDNPFTRPPKRVYWFDAWEGLLSGYYLRT